MSACLTEGASPMPPDAWTRDTTSYVLMTRGLRATCVGDAALARRCLGAVKTRPARRLAALGAGPALLEARLATMEGRPEDAVRILRPFSLLPMETNDPPFGVGLVWVRWSIADAFERTGQPDSAAVHLERNLLIPIEETPFWPLVHRRLALLYARMGRVDDALRHLAAVEKLWDRPDPEVRRMLDETRASVTAAQRRRS